MFMAGRLVCAAFVLAIVFQLSTFVFSLMFIRIKEDTQRTLSRHVEKKSSCQSEPTSRQTEPNHIHASLHISSAKLLNLHSG